MKKDNTVLKVILMAVAYLATFILVLFLIAGEADLGYIIATVVLTALAELLRKLFGYDTKKGVRWSFIPFALSFFAYTSHWWTDTEGSLAGYLFAVNSRFRRFVFE